MNYNNSFPEDINIKPIEKGDVIEEKGNNINENNKEENNNENEIDTKKNIFISLPSKLESEEINNNIYDSLFVKELIKYNLCNLFAIIKKKIIILNTQVFYRLKNYSRKKIIYLIKSEILFLKISSSIQILANIFRVRLANKLYQIFYILGDGKKMNNHIFRIKYEIKYKNEKDNIINESTLKLKQLEKEINDMKNNIKLLNLRESELKLKINNLSTKEGQLNDSIKQIKYSKYFYTNNMNSINNNSIYESDIITLESAIDNSKQQKEEKKKIINNFVIKVNKLLDEYQEYIDSLNSSTSSINNNTNINTSEYSNQNKINLKFEDKGVSSNNKNPSKLYAIKKQNNINIETKNIIPKNKDDIM